jgi:hypothetical protein
MTYRERVLEAYRQSLIAYGVNELTLKTALTAFQTGYDAGILHKKNNDEQEHMENTILYETEVM